MHLKDESILPWQVSSRGALANDGVTAGLWTKNNSTSVCWLYRTNDTAPTNSAQRDFASVAPAGTGPYTLIWIDPWSGAEFKTETVTDLVSIEYWLTRMDSVLPNGFDELQKQDVLLIIKGK
ncbi:MAG: hypothetical protein V1754_08530 [Pseudomonadota bacterium]